LTEIFGFISSTSRLLAGGVDRLSDCGICSPVCRTYGHTGRVPLSFPAGELAARSHWPWRWWSSRFCWFAKPRKQRTAYRRKTLRQAQKKHTDRKGRIYRYRVRNDFWRGSAAGFGGVLQGLVGFFGWRTEHGGADPARNTGTDRGGELPLDHRGGFDFRGGGAFDGERGPRDPGSLESGRHHNSSRSDRRTSRRCRGRPDSHKHTIRLVLAGFLTFIGALSAYRASVGMGIHLPAWVLWTSVILCPGSHGAVYSAPEAVAETCRTSAGVCASCGPQNKSHP